MGDVKRRKRRNPNYSKVRRKLHDISELQREMFLAKYRELGRFAALVDPRQDNIPFITLKTLQSPASEDSLFRRAAGPALLEALSHYNPEQEGILLHLWDVVDDLQEAITLQLQLRRLTFGHIPFDPTDLPPGSGFIVNDSLAIAQTVLLATSEPMGPVIEIESLPLDPLGLAVTPIPAQRQVS